MCNRVTSDACKAEEFGMWGVADCTATSNRSVIPTSFISTQPSPTPNHSYKYCDNDNVWILNPDNNKCYTRVEEKKKFVDASSYCQGIGGQLASIHSADENEFILGS
uniref:C-type lectin domain-containing protein n=1 Tax=Acrobeloides nanus TaxID=290746 RepID=A0A914CW80_9BILA